jgi:hypothetical protein
MITIIEQDGKLVVSAPFISGLPKKFKIIGGHWNKPSWEFLNNNPTKENLQKCISQIFGFEFGSPTAAAVVTVTQDIYLGGQPVIFAGFVLARPWIKNVGAKIGAGVTLLDNKISSAKNGLTKIEKGTKFSIENFPVRFTAVKRLSVEFQ